MKSNYCISVLFISISLLFPIHQLHSQYAWSEPAAASDSLSDNRNAVIVELPFLGATDHYIFWEKSVDSTATAIYYRNFYTSGEPVLLLGGENIHYRNPQFMRTFNSEEDTLFYFFYESDQNGTFDIFFQVYTVNGFDAPEILAGSQEDETHFNCDGAGSMVWQEGDKIKFAYLHNWDPPFYISDPVTIDSSNCSEPDIPPDDTYFSSSSYICWMKTVDDISSVYYTYYDGTVTEPTLLSSSGNNVSPHFAMSSCISGGGLGDIISWESIIAGEHTIKARNLWEGNYTSNFSQPALYLPAVALYSMPVDQLNANGFMAFINDDGQNSDVMVNDGGSYIPEDLQYYINISDSPNQETHPAFFNGRPTAPYFTDLILIWESEHNDHWQLFYSINTLACGGAINEIDNSQRLELKISPNPARNECEIKYRIAYDGPVAIKLYTSDGRQILLADQKFLQKGEYSCHLDFDKVFSGENYSGLFMIRLQAGNSSIAQKVIRLN